MASASDEATAIAVAIDRVIEEKRVEDDAVGTEFESTIFPLAEYLLVEGFDKVDIAQYFHDAVFSYLDVD